MDFSRRIPALALALLLLAACSPGVPATPTAAALSTATPAQAATVTPAITPAAPGVTPTVSPVARVQPTSPATPTATPAPTQTGGPSGCADSALFVADVTVRDNTVFAPGAPFTKTWRLRNTGTCAWGDSYRLVFISGDALDGPNEVPITGEVAPEATYDVSVNLVAPASPGTYKGNWQMRNAGGALFGTRLYVQIEVSAGAPTPTAAPP
jgi:hypothetical protein